MQKGQKSKKEYSKFDQFQFPKVKIAWPLLKKSSLYLLTLFVFPSVSLSVCLSNSLPVFLADSFCLCLSLFLVATLLVQAFLSRHSTPFLFPIYTSSTLSLFSFSSFIFSIHHLISSISSFILIPSFFLHLSASHTCTNWNKIYAKSTSSLYFTCFLCKSELIIYFFHFPWDRIQTK